MALTQGWRERMKIWWHTVLKMKRRSGGVGEMK